MAEAAPIHVVIDDDTETVRVDPVTGTVGGIYKLIFPDGRFYIGSSKKLRVRILEHKARLRNGKHGNPRLQRAWDKLQSMETSTLLVCREDDLLFYEQICIDKLHPQLNLSFIAGRTSWSDESRRKLSQTTKGRRLSVEHRAKISKAKKGVSTGPQSAETRLKRAETLRGNTRAAGSVRTPEEKARISAFMKGNKYRAGLSLSADHKAKILASLVGNTRTLGRVRPDEERRQIGARMKEVWAQKRALKVANDASV